MGLLWKGRDGTLPGGRPRAWECSPCREGGPSPPPGPWAEVFLLVEGGLRNRLGRARASLATLLRRGALLGHVYNVPRCT
ncbi:rCG39031, isoform CRA_c [Rattus norvegicus]|uniref:RCG39031, isoform CRA_c n=1 Tax=Rattus norvegicus TaxID=10116 RepID=A6JY27_RAT|nr:rCG39031, isoform CRA_c [Rattus norvegicus]